MANRIPIIGSRFLVGAVVMGLVWAATQPAAARDRLSREAINAGSVTILTDGLSRSGGRGAQAMRSLARAISQPGKLRVLPIAGEGGFQNLRDLLYLRGVDFAILNSDVLTHQELFGPYQGARRQAKLVARLFDQRIVLLARPGIENLAALAGRAVGVIGETGAGRITAETLFGLLGIEAKLTALGDDGRAADALARVDAVLALEEELVNAPIARESWRQFTPLAIEMTPDLAKTYEAAALERTFPFGTPPARTLTTLRTTTVLGVFNWPSTADRYDAVTQFIGEFFKSLVDLRLGAGGEVWQQVAVTEPVPGWERYGPAEPGRWLGGRELKRVATVMPTRLVEPAPGEGPAPRPSRRAPPSATIAAATPPEPRTAGRRVKALVLELPPFSGRKLADGGMLTALLGTALAGDTDALVSGLDVEWVDAGLEAAVRKLQGGGYDILLPSETIDCEAPGGLSRGASFLCDAADLTTPIMPVVIGLFVAANSAISTLPGEGGNQVRVCAETGRRLGPLEPGPGKATEVVRRDDLAGCVSLVESGEADGFVANELEGRFLIRRLGLDGAFRLLEEPIETRAMHAAVLKRRPGADNLRSQLDARIEQIKQTSAYGAVVRDHVMSIWRTETSLQR